MDAQYQDDSEETMNMIVAVSLICASIWASSASPYGGMIGLIWAILALILSVLDWRSQKGKP